LRLLHLSDVPASPPDRLFRQSRTRALAAVALVLAASIGSTVLGWQRHAPLLFYLAVVFLTSLIVLQRLVTARFRPTNWMVRATGDGLYIQLRSYLNYHFPDRPTVVLIPYGAIRSARAIRGRRELPDPDSTRYQNSTTIQRFRSVRLELTGDVSPLTRALDEEIRRAVGKSRADGLRTRYHHVPVRMASPTTLELEWAVVPREDHLLALLASHGVPTDRTEATSDYSQLETLGRDEQERRLLELVERGDTIAAIRIARRLYGYDLTRAKQFVASLGGGREEPPG